MGKWASGRMSQWAELGGCMCTVFGGRVDKEWGRRRPDGHGGHGGLKSCRAQGCTARLLSNSIHDPSRQCTPHLLLFGILHCPEHFFQ